MIIGTNSTSYVVTSPLAACGAFTATLGADMLSGIPHSVGVKVHHSEKKVTSSGQRAPDKWQIQDSKSELETLSQFISLAYLSDQQVGGNSGGGEMGNKIWDTIDKRGLMLRANRSWKDFKQLTSIFTCFDVYLNLHKCGILKDWKEENEQALGKLSAGPVNTAAAGQDDVSVFCYISDSFSALPDLYTLLTCFWKGTKTKGREI